MVTVEWPSIPLRKTLYAAVMFPFATVILLYGEGDLILSTTIRSVFFLIHFLTLLLVSYTVTKNTSRRILPLDTPLFWRYLLTLTYGATPFIFNTLVYVVFQQRTPSAFSIYSGGLLCIFGGITAILMTKEIPEAPISQDYLEKIYGEALQLVWPYTFSFVLMLIASPFVAVQLQQGIDMRSLVKVIFVGMIGFVTLIVMPLSNLSDIRREMYKQKPAEKPK